MRKTEGRKRREDILEQFKQTHKVEEVVSFEEWEDKGAYLEGTGSLILDRENKLAYASISERTMDSVLDDFSKESSYEVVKFHSFQTIDGERMPIYHTNVMMCIGEEFAIVCLDCVDDKGERQELLDSLNATGKEVIEISESQADQFAGNMLQLLGSEGQRLIVMSSAAYESLIAEQVIQLEKHGKIIFSDLTTIETLGGGSARCMMAEVFNPRLN